MEVKAQDLCMSYLDGGHTVDVFGDVDFSVQSGKSVAIVGESGVGKTTLLYLLSGLEKPSSGSVTLGNTCLTDDSLSANEIALFRGMHIGFVFQFHQLLSEFSAIENVSMPLLLQEVDKEKAAIRSKELLERVSLGHRETHRPGAMSGGEQQRVAVARAFAAQPGIIFADEPTGNLDVRTGDMVSELLLEMHREHKMTLVVVTHSLDLARKMDRVIEMTATGLVER